MQFQHPSGPTSPAGPMNQYRLYFLDSVDGLISSVFEFEAADDEAALRLADDYCQGRDAELWSGVRKLETWQH